MSFQAYLDNIKTKTGKTPDDFRVSPKRGDCCMKVSKPVRLWRG